MLVSAAAEVAGAPDRRADTMTTTTLTRERVNRLQDKTNQALLDHDWSTLERLPAGSGSARCG